jgi:hypothetical protein
MYRIESLEGLVVIINHFDKYPLITKKLADYTLFKLAYNLIKDKNHLVPPPPLLFPPPL